MNNGIFWELAEEALEKVQKIEAEKVKVKKEEVKVEKMKDPDLMKEKQALLYKYVKKFSEDFYTKEHPKVMTCEAAEEHVNHLFKDTPHVFCKNLFLKEKKTNALFIVLADENTKTRLNVLSKSLKLKGLRFASSETLCNVLLVEQGAVTGFALYPGGLQAKDIVKDNKIVMTKAEIEAIRKVTVIYDSTMVKTEKRLLFHPLVNTATSSIKGEDMWKFLQSLPNKMIVFDFEQGKAVE